jgi:hypothetical protein
MIQQPRELAHRAGGGIEVTLYWNADENRTHIEIRHAATEVTFAFAVARECALDAFYHPFAHLQTADAPRAPAAVRS